MSDEISYPLHDAAASGDIDALNRLLEDGADVDARDDTGRTPLFCAARNGETFAARHLLKRGARVDCETREASTALLTAARGGHAEMVRLLLANGADPNQIVHPQMADETPEQEEAARKLYELSGLPAPTEQERAESRRKFETPRMVNSLAAAIMSRDSETILALIEGGADVNNTSGPSGMPPLRTAVAFGDPAIIRLLIQHGASVNSGDDEKHGASILSAAVMKQRVDVARILLEAGADPNASGHFPPLTFAVQFNNPEMVKLLLQFGADPAQMVEVMARGKPEILALFATHRGTGWHDLVVSGDMDGVRSRLDEGVEIDARNDKGMTALMLAAEAGHTNIVELLLERGAGANAGDNFQVTPLMYGVRKGHVDVVRALLAHGADVNATNKWGQTAFVSALSDDKTEIRQVLVDAGATISIVEAALLGDSAKVMEFLAQGVPVDQSNSAGTTALMAAAKRGDVELASALHERGASLSLLDTMGDSAFHHAVQHASGTGDTALLALMLNWGADIHAAGKFGMSVLQTPVFAGSEPVMRFLLDHGADPNAPANKTGRPLLHDAILLGRGKLAPIRILLEYGADVEATDTLGSTALLTAIGLSKTSIEDDAERAQLIRSVAGLLIEKGANVNATSMRSTACRAAIGTGDIELVRLLLDAGADAQDAATLFSLRHFNTPK